MPRYRPKQCRDCGTRVGHISYRGLCTDCQVARVCTSSTSMATKSGPYYNRWRDVMVEIGQRLSAEAE